MSIITDSLTIIREDGPVSFIRRVGVRLLRDTGSLITWIAEERNSLTRYHLIELERGLQDCRRDTPTLHDDDVKRIIRAFRSAKTDQQNQPVAYQVTGDWALIVREHHHDLASALERQDLAGVRKILDNFARDKVSRGLHLSGNLPRSFFDKIRLLAKMNRSYRIWKRMTDLPDAVLEYPKEIGNMHGADSAGRSVMMPAFHQSYFAQRIGGLFPGRSDRKRIILEIGGGYGSLPLHLFRDTPLNLTYISLDIPEVCVLSAYFLMSNFPDKRFLLYGERQIGEREAVLEYDMIILPNFSLPSLPDTSCDLVFNSHSLTQMDPGTIKEYIRQINRICRRYFLHANDETEEKNLRGDGQYINLNSGEFELPRESFSRVYRFPELIRDDWQPGGGFSTWEYLYERIHD